MLLTSHHHIKLLVMNNIDFWKKGLLFIDLYGLYFLAANIREPESE